MFVTGLLMMDRVVGSWEKKKLSVHTCVMRDVISAHLCERRWGLRPGVVSGVTFTF